MTRILTFAVFLWLPMAAIAQFNYVLDQTVPVQGLPMAWAGGLNAAQFNTMDLNGDGKDDLVLFDRMANKVITFLNEDNAYVSRPEYAGLFPADVTNWLLLRDFNCDGRKDIFTGHVLGIKVYTQVSGAGLPAWEHFVFYTGSSGSKSPVLLTQGNSLINLQIQFDDLPAITDADGDGDLDIFNIRYGGSGVEFHQNLSVENGWGCDSLAFKRITQKWGNFTECECGIIALNGSDCPPHGGGRTKHAGGKTLTAIDANGDSSIDLLFSEADCNQLYLLPNTGGLHDPLINEFTPFPSSHPVSFSVFPAAFYEDLDFDGTKDLVASPNIFTKVSSSDNLGQSNWFFRNDGTDSDPAFRFIQSDLIQDRMIDVGDNSVPAFADYDGDGDADMFISRHNTPGGLAAASSIHFYENTGAPHTPAFRLVTEDFLHFSDTQLFNLKIQFADMNADETIDLIWTASGFGGNGAGLYYLPNKSKDILDFAGQSVVDVDFDLNSSENVHLADVDGDGAIDILAGRSNGAIEFWRRTGSPSSHNFELWDDNFLGIASGLTQSPACFLADLNADGKVDFLFGGESGKLKIIDDFRNSSGAGQITDILLDPFSRTYRSRNLGGKIWPVAVNLFSSKKPAIAVGNTLGGIHLLRNENEFAIYPNPFEKDDVLKIEVDEPTVLFIYTPTGGLVGRTELNPGQDPMAFDRPNLAPGLYIFRFVSAGRSFARKIIIR